MLLKDFLPSPAVRDFVQWYRIADFEFAKGSPPPHKMYPPKPENILHFFVRGDFSIGEDGGSHEKTDQSPITFMRQRTFVTKQLTSCEFLNFQIVFQPTALYCLLGIPASVLTDSYMDATLLFPKEILLKQEQLQEARSYNEMLNIGEQFVLSLIARGHKGAHLLDGVCREMIRLNGNASLDWLAGQSCLCPRQLDRKFHEQVGLGPKTYSRIIRMTRAFNLKNRFPDMDWLRIAIECGYFDYQHLVRDYKAFTGVAPTVFHMLEAQSPERSLGIADELYKSRG